jgi:signal transduction histidine kinase
MSDPRKQTEFEAILPPLRENGFEFVRIAEGGLPDPGAEVFAGFDILILDTGDHPEWRRILERIRNSSLPLAVVLFTKKEDREFDLEAIRLGAAESAVVGRLGSYALERILNLAMYRKQVVAEIREREADLLIQERLAAVGMLASGMAHEIGTPLGVIRGRAEVLMFRNQGNEAILKDLRVIVGQADRIAGLMRSLLNLARGDDLRSSRSIDLGGVVRDVLDLMNQVLMLEGIRVIREMPAEVPFQAHADSEPFHQIILNLIQNALHAIEVARETGRMDGHEIRVSILDAGTDWCLEVSDTGCGMTPEVVRNLFRPFFTTKGIGKGIGLGLSLSYRILESWRGGISVESTPGLGSVFRISIPKAGSLPVAAHFGSPMNSVPSL